METDHRVDVQVRSHPKKRINKKWRKRYGVLSLTVPSDTLECGEWAVREYIRDHLRAWKGSDHGTSSSPCR